MKLKEKYKDITCSLKREKEETKELFRIFLEYLNGEEIEEHKKIFFENQSKDILRMLAISAIGIISVPGAIVIAEALKKKDIKLYPQNQMEEQQIKKLIRETVLNSMEENSSLEKRLKFNIELPNDLMELNRIFTSNGYELYVVGGAVRDALTGKEPKDFDLATNAKPFEITQILSSGYKIIEAGNIFPVVHTKTPDENVYEIATFRVDKGDNHIKPETEFSTIDQDVKRRDLTINALFYDISKREIVDLVGGIEDIKNGVIRTVGSAQKRFDENRIRVLRAIRFAARIGSELDADIKNSLAKDSGLHREAKEAIMAEFLKGIKQTKSVIVYFKMIYEFGIEKWIFEGLNSSFKNVVETKNTPVLFACILRGNEPKDIKNKLVENLKYPKEFASEVAFLVSMMNFKPSDIVAFKKEQQRLRVSNENIILFAKFSGIDMNLINKFCNFKLTVTFNDLQHLGLKGEEISKEINRIETDKFKNYL